MRCRLTLLVLAAVLAASRSEAQSDVPPSSAFQELAWRFVGPYRGGRCTTVAGVPGDGRTFWMGACGGGLWRTRDAGTSWQNVSDDHFKTASVGAIAVAPSNPSVVWVGMGEAQIRGVTTTHGDGVYRTNDGGRTWEHLGLERTRHISAIVVHPRDPDTAWVAAQGLAWGPSPERGVYVTRNGGESWERVLFIDGMTGACSLSIHPDNPRVLYAGMWQHVRKPWQMQSGGPASGIYRSVDMGRTWQLLTEGLPDPMGKVGVAVSPARPERVWAIIEADEGGLYRSDDAGDTWQRVNKERVLRARAWYYTRVFADPVDPETVYVLNAPVMRSIDGGKSFERVQTPHGDNHALWIDPADPLRMINGNDGGANVTLNGGGTWSTQSNQPTAQFYRVSTDAAFPYRIYGGQQDNSTVSIPSRTTGNGIGREDWYPIGGGESAFVAFDPNDPQFVYAGVYQGIITRWDRRTRQARAIMAYPYLGLGADPRDLRYRFNWNAPIVASPHDPSTIYHAGNVVLRTKDGGQSWTEISPDLTRNENDKQGQGGAPFTNEAAGAETYNTIQYLAAHPRRPGTLWVGTDDGLVHRTTDEGKTWNDLTPEGIGEAMINSIEISPHDADTVWLAVTRYKLGDYTPHAFVSTDNGTTWHRRTVGLPAEAFVRVIREDPDRQGLVYAGTEAGPFVSFDHGRNWEPLQLNLPPVPITDLTIRDGDVVLATQGRGFWILDDVEPLRFARRVSDLQLIAPRPTVAAFGGGWQEAPTGRGQNAPGGVVLDYVLGPDFDADDLLLSIRNADGDVIREFRAGGDGKPKLKTEPGHHRLVWDLRRESVPEIPNQHHLGSRNGPKAPAGVYSVVLSAGGIDRQVLAEVVDDPRAPAAEPVAVAEHQRTAVEIWRAARSLHERVNDFREMQDELGDLLKRLDDPKGDLHRQTEGIDKSIDAWIEGVVQTKQETFQDVINFPNRLNAEILDLLSRIDRSGAPLTSGQTARARDLLDEWNARRKAADAIERRVRELEAAVREADVPTFRRRD